MGKSLKIKDQPPTENSTSTSDSASTTTVDNVTEKNSSNCEDMGDSSFIRMNCSPATMSFIDEYENSLNQPPPPTPAPRGVPTRRTGAMAEHGNQVKLLDAIDLERESICTRSSETGARTLSNLRSEDARLIDDFLSLSPNTYRIKTEYCDLHSDIKSLKSYCNQMNLSLKSYCNQMKLQENVRVKKISKFFSSSNLNNAMHMLVDTFT